MAFAKKLLRGVVRGDLTWGQNKAQMIHIDVLYCRQVCFLNFKGTPSREEHKTGFSVLRTFELNLLAEFAKSCKVRPPYNDLRNLAPTS
jgi:hypothetical protein